MRVKVASSYLSRRRKLLEPYLYLLPGICLLIVFMIYPIAKGVFTSFCHYKLNDPNTYFSGLHNYRVVLSEPEFRLVLSNSLWWVLGSITFQFTLGLILAVLLNRPFWGRGLYQAVVLAPWAVPGFLIGLIWKWLFNGQYGVINDLLLRLRLIEKPISFLAMPSTALQSVIVANIWYGIPFFAIMILAALQSIPTEIYDAADVDGAGPITKFFRITLPYIRPTILVTILLRVIWILNYADIIYVMTKGGPLNSSDTLASYIIHKAYTVLDFGQASALGVIFMLILLAYTVTYLTLTKFSRAGEL
ncbi:MAG: sugar ABC transporter permease [Firmicutes bacterium]|nr:sugar ABC transporter permease [Bacillota bacterium]